MIHQGSDIFEEVKSPRRSEYKSQFTKVVRYVNQSFHASSKVVNTLIKFALRPKVRQY